MPLRLSSYSASIFRTERWSSDEGRPPGPSAFSRDIEEYTFPVGEVGSHWNSSENLTRFGLVEWRTFSSPQSGAVRASCLGAAGLRPRSAAGDRAAFPVGDEGMSSVNFDTFRTRPRAARGVFASVRRGTEDTRRSPLQRSTAPVEEQRFVGEASCVRRPPFFDRIASFAGPPEGTVMMAPGLRIPRIPQGSLGVGPTDGSSKSRTEPAFRSFPKDRVGAVAPSCAFFRATASAAAGLAVRVEDGSKRDSSARACFGEDCCTSSTESRSAKV